MCSAHANKGNTKPIGRKPKPTSVKHDGGENPTHDGDGQKDEVNANVQWEVWIGASGLHGDGLCFLADVRAMATLPAGVVRGDLAGAGLK